MALPGTGSTNQAQTISAFKKLAGKANTSTLREFYEETIPSNIQVKTDTVFAEDIPQTVSANSADLYTRYSASAGKPQTVEFVEFTIESILGTDYDANTGSFGTTGFGGGDEAQSAGFHGYQLKLHADYNVSSSNPVSGTAPFSSSQVVHETNGALQLVSPSFGPQSGNNYTIQLYTSKGGSRIFPTDPIDWVMDYFNGVLFIQDYNASKVPTYALGYIYTGKMASTAITDASGSGGGISDIVSDTTPQLGGDLDVNGKDIVSVSNGDIDIKPHGAGKVNLDGDGSTNGVSISDGLIEMRTGNSSPAQIDMYCEVNNAHKVSLKAPAHADYSGNVTFVLPTSNGISGSVLKSDGTGATSWGEAGISYSRRKITANATSSVNDTIIGISSSGNSDNIELRLVAANTLSNGQYFTVKKEDNYNSTVTISCSAGNKIDGQNSIIIESHFGAVNIYSDATSSYFIY